MSHEILKTMNEFVYITKLGDWEDQLGVIFLRKRVLEGHYIFHSIHFELTKLRKTIQGF